MTVNKIRRLHIMSPEPPVSSVVMTHGLAGTVWQRMAHDELWASTAGDKGVPWWRLMNDNRNIFLIIDSSTVTKKETANG